MQLYDYQRTGADFLAGSQCGLLADEMGLGKTPQAIEATNTFACEPVTAIVPAILAEEWRNEFYNWHDVPRDIGVVGNKRDSLNAHFLVCSYNRATRPEVYEKLAERGGTFIYDESHFLKSPEAKRSQTLLGPESDGKGGLAATAARNWFLTGTPCPNTAGELYSMLATGGRFNGNYHQFLNRFCVLRETPWGRQVTGYKKADELRSLLQGFMLRRTNAVSLPKMHEGELYVEPSDCAGETVMHNLRRIEPKATVKIERAIKQGSFANLDTPHVATLRRLIGLAKVNAVAKRAADMLTHERGAKLVLFCVHKLVISELANQLQEFGVVTLEGGSTDAQRKKRKDQFQDDPDTRIAICQIQAAGVGLTLTAANHLWIVEPSWVPAENDQAKRRIYRIGQKRETFISVVTLNTSLDHAINGVLRRKRSLIDEIIAD